MVLTPSSRSAPKRTPVSRVPTCGCPFLACCPDENRPIVSECTSLPSKYLTCGKDISQCAPLYLGPRAALAGGWPRNAPADAVLTSPENLASQSSPGAPLSQRERNSPVDCFLGRGCRDWAHTTGDHLFVLPPFMGATAVAFFFCCYFSLGVFRCTSPSGAASSLAASLRTTYRSQLFFCFK